MTIKIPVEADFKGASVEQQLQAFQQKLNALGQQIAQANKTKFEPIGKTTLSDLQRVTQQFEALRRVSGDLNKRINATGQKGRGFTDLDWGALYPDSASRARQMAKAFSYVTGHAIVPPVPGPRPNQPPGGAGWQQAGVGAVQAGLRAASGATGGVGGVAAGALGTGMSSGFGAGMAGLLGGIVALGVSKIVGAAVEKVKQAEDSSVAYDKLKRTLGDVNVSFNALKMAVGGTVRGMNGFATTNQLGIGDAIAMVSRYAKTGGVSGGNIAGILGEVGAGVGLSRAYGLDPSKGVDVLGQARGVRYNKNDQDTRKYALLIGETIGKSGAFSKADEVMDAIGDYVTSQTRASHSANASGFAGMFSSMVGSGIAGLDPAGAASLLARINSSLSAGGAAGEASQFMTTALGQRHGMDVFDTQLWREGGAFATAGNTFGEGPVGDFYKRHGLTAPAGDETLYGASMDDIRRRYGNNPKMMLKAMSRHLGVNMRNAAALEGLTSNQFGDLGARLGRAKVDIKDVNFGGMQLLSQIESGTGADRMKIATGLLGRTGKDKLGDEDRAALNKVMSEGSLDQQKDLLTKLVATRDQEQTQGKDIQASKVALENMKELMANELIPLTQSMRDGIMWMAGGKDGKSEKTIRESMAKASIDEEYAPLFRDLENEAANIKGGGPFSAFSNGQAQTEYINKHKAVRDKIAALNEKKNSDIEAALGKLKTKTGDAPALPEAVTPDNWRSFDNPQGAAFGSAPATGGGSTGDYDALFAKYGKQYNVDPRLLKAIARKESSMNPNAVGRLNANGSQDFGLMQHNSRYLAERGLTDSWNNPERSIEEAAKLLRRNIDASGGNVRTGVRKYNGSGPAAEAYASDIMARVGNTPMPEDAVAAQRAADQRMMSGHVTFDDARITLQYPDGRLAAPQMSLDPRFKQMPAPFGRVS